MRKTLAGGIIVALLALVASPAFAGYAGVNDGHGAGDGHACDNCADSGDFTFFTTPTKWDPGAWTASIGGFPAPGGATWSIMGPGVSDAPVDDHGPVGPTATTDLTSLMPGSELAAIAASFATWAAVSGFTDLGMVADSGATFGAADPVPGLGAFGDIRIGAIFIDGAVGPNTLAHAFQPGNESIFGAGGSVAGDMHFDNGNTWSDEVLAPGTGIDFHTVMLHELGHALGLGHSSVAGSVMEPFYAGVRRTLHADDIAGIQAIYGPGSSAVVPLPSGVFAGLGLLGLLGGYRAHRRRKSAA